MPQLDALRAFAVGAVLLHHFLPDKLLPWPFTAIPWGFLGVRLFFVISGFLITGILLRARDAAASANVRPSGVLYRFYARRFLRIFPLYYLVVLAGIALNLPPMRDEWLWLLSYTLNLRISALGWYPENISHFWSLAVEEQFYLLWPFVVLFAPKRLLMRIAIGMVLIGIGYRALAILNGLPEATIYVFTLSSFDTLGLGCAVAIACRGNRPAPTLVQRLRATVLPAGLAMAVALELVGAIVEFGGYLHQALFDTAIGLVFCWLVAASASGFTGFAGRLLMARPLLYCGRIAYGIYVYHLLLKPLVILMLEPLALGPVASGWSILLAGTTLTIAVASLSWYAFERPINALKRHFPYLGRDGTGARRKAVA